MSLSLCGENVNSYTSWWKIYLNRQCFLFQSNSIWSIIFLATNEMPWSFSLSTRAEKSKSLIRWKRRKGGKRREKAEKADLVMQLAFWQTCQNAIKCHEMISVHPMLNMWCMTNHLPPSWRLTRRAWEPARGKGMHEPHTWPTHRTSEPAFTMQGG